MIESILYNIAIYCRLSLDDGSLGESGSIQTQKMMLKNIVVIITLLLKKYILMMVIHD